MATITDWEVIDYIEECLKDVVFERNLYCCIS